ncbi:hypothetical protein [Marinoscillum sp.]|uniref:hypothetical protein n=1 Tax=Marinoscillum sp. TaxID=2024838 RepID=UPI003BA9AAC2
MKSSGLGIIIFISCVWHLGAQPLDSIPFGKVKMQSGNYELNRQGIREIQLKSGTPSPFTPAETHGKENFSESVWTLLTGLSTSTLIESAWHYPNEIHLVGSGQINLPFIVMDLMRRHVSG